MCQSPPFAAQERRRSSSTVVDELVADQRATCEQVVPWFFENMHPAYFSQVDTATQRQHLRAIVAVQSSQSLNVPEIMLSSTSGVCHQYAVISSGDTRDPRQQIEKLPEGTLTRVLLTTSKDGKLSLNVFDVTPPESAGSFRSRPAANDQGAPPPSLAASVNSSGDGLLLHGDGLKRFAVGWDATEEERTAFERHAGYHARLEAGDLSTHAGTPSRRSKPFSVFADGGDGGDGSEATVDLALKEFLSRCSSSYVTHQLPRLLVKQRRLYEAVRGRDDAMVEMETAEQGSRDWSAISEGCTLLTAALPGVEPRAAVRRMLALLELHAMELHLAQVDTIDDPEGDGYVTLLRTVVAPDGGSRRRHAPLTDDDWERLKRDACRLKWVDDPALTMASRSAGSVPLRTAEVLLALADLSLSVVSDRPLLSREGIHHRLDRPEERSFAVSLAELLIARFDPSGPVEEPSFLSQLDDIGKRAEAGLRDADSSALLATMCSAVRNVMRTNLYIERRWALCLRIDPSFLDDVLHRLPSSAGLPSNKPYGVFFVSGRHFNGYHVRFSDIARGGLRVVLPPSLDAHATESRRHFNECFRLAWAQQLKNKDIPEGGAKAVCLVYPVPGQKRERLMHKCVKKFTDALLDLISPRQRPVPSDAGPFGSCHNLNAFSPDGSHGGGVTSSELLDANGDDPVVSRGGCEAELLYLGPDENITPRDIDWMASHAEQRGYKMPSAFISSKPAAGINHKEFGVTSEGVAVFLHEGLLSIGIDPRTQPWTVKLTGGPDGDVAGNMLRILNREYGKTVRVVGIADGYACCEDPDGIPMAELIRLADASLPTSGLDRTTLGPRGKLTLADTREGAAARNTMHNRVVADAFVPAGGRPSTVNAANWRDFMQPDGVTPSARLVVEGANLFFDATARSALYEHCGLPIVKDSSANKCGVICSSLEIVASMLLTAHEFKAIKPRYVPQVLTRLRSLARLEAQMLFAEAAKDANAALPALSERISVCILRVGLGLDAALDALPRDEQKRLFPLVMESAPPVLFEDAAVRANASRTLPWPYQRSCITSGLASRLVYREGLAFVEALPDTALANYALAYLRGEQRARDLTAKLAAANLGSFGTEVEALLMKGGVRAATEALLANPKAVLDLGAE